MEIGQLTLSWARDCRGIIRSFIVDEGNGNLKLIDPSLVQALLQDSSDESRRLLFKVRVGVEWETPDRGKHNGDMKLGFTCDDNRASFVKIDKLHYSQDFLHSLIKKYEDESESKDNQRQEYHITDKVVSYETLANGKVIAIETYGMDKVKEKQKLMNIENASLHAAGVGIAGNSNAISLRCPNLAELDLSFNLFSSWDEILDILRSLSPHLRAISLSENRLGSFPKANCSEKLIVSFEHMHEVVFNKIFPINENSFATTKKLEQSSASGDAASLYPIHHTKAPLYRIASWNCWKSLRSLYLCGYEPYGLDIENALELSKPISQLFPLLESIDLSENGIGEWIHIRDALGSLPYLRRLSLNGNPIMEITTISTLSMSGSANSKLVYFPKLESLSLLSTKIKDLKSLDVINSELDTVHDLKIHDNELTCYKALTFRQTIISRIKNLKFLNGTEVSKVERVDSERLYIKAIEHAKETQSVHPRFAELLEIHGSQTAPSELDANATNVTKKTLASSMIKLIIVLHQSLVSIATSKSKARSADNLSILFPKNKSGKQLYHVCHKTYGIPITEFKLLYSLESNVVTGASSSSMSVPDDDTTMSELGIENGNVINIVPSN